MTTQTSILTCETPKFPVELFGQTETKKPMYIYIYMHKKALNQYNIYSYAHTLEFLHTLLPNLRHETGVLLWAKNIPVNVTVNHEVYSQAKEQGINFSEALRKGLKEYSPPEKKHSNIKCDFCGKELMNGEIKWIFANIKDYERWKLGEKPNAHCKVCKYDHLEFTDTQLLAKCKDYGGLVE